MEDMITRETRTIAVEVTDVRNEDDALIGQVVRVPRDTARPERFVWVAFAHDWEGESANGDYDPLVADVVADDPATAFRVIEDRANAYKVPVEPLGSVADRDHNPDGEYANYDKPDTDV